MSLRNAHVSILVAVAAAAGVLQAWLARDYLLDDALIHVRAAALLLRAGFPTADGVTRSLTDSSPAFLLLTAAGYWLTSSFYVTKILSLAGYLALIALLGRKALKETEPVPQALAVACLLLAVSPFAVRWLSDGMETSLAVVCVLLFASAGSRAKPGWAALLAGLCVLLRVELAALVVFAAAGELLRGRPKTAAAALLGAVVGLLAIHLFAGTIVPDAAIAKARSLYSIGEFVTLLAGVAVGAGVFGLGLVACWLGLVAAIVVRLRHGRRIDDETRALLLEASSLPAVLLAIFIRGQAVEGIRPLLPFIAYSLFCVIRLFGHLDAGRSDPWRRAAAGVLAVFAVGCVVDGLAFDRLVRLQSRSLVAMRDKDWSSLRGHTGLAWDVGYLAYFTRTPICDVQGLIEGPRFAHLQLDERLERCARIAEFAFVDQNRFAMLATEHDLTGWRICDRFDFARRSEAYPVYLLVAPGLAMAPLCAATSPRISQPGKIDLSKLAPTAG